MPENTKETILKKLESQNHPYEIQDNVPMFPIQTKEEAEEISKAIDKRFSFGFKYKDSAIIS